jgi:hypothetical protein
MTAPLLEDMITAQGALIAALDSRDADAITEAARRLDTLIAGLRAQSTWRESGAVREPLGHALKQTDAARIRINYLSDWTRQRIDSIAELRGGALSQTYAKPHKISENPARL